MNLKHKTLMFVTLFIFCIGSVCASDPNDDINIDSKTDDKSIQSDDDNLISPTDNFIKNYMEKINKDNKKLNDDINNLVSDHFKSLEDINKLKKSNKQKDIEIQKLNEDVKQLKEDNKKLNVEIQDLKDRLDKKDLEIKQLHDDKDKLNTEKDKLHYEKENLYEKYLNGSEIENLDQLRKQIADKDNQINELNAKIRILNNIIAVSKNDVYNSLKDLISVEKIQCGKYVFEHDDYLKIPLIKEGKNTIIKYKKDNGRLPNFVTIAGYELPQEKYIKLYNM